MTLHAKMAMPEIPLSAKLWIIYTRFVSLNFLLLFAVFLHLCLWLAHFLQLMRKDGETYRNKHFKSTGHDGILQKRWYLLTYFEILEMGLVQGSSLVVYCFMASNIIEIKRTEIVMRIFREKICYIFDKLNNQCKVDIVFI